MRLHMLIPILVVASPLSAQVPWTANVPQRGIALDFLRPKFQGGGTSLTSFAAFLSGRFPLGDKAAVRFELPFARGSTDFGGSSTTIGNPYVGIETGGATGLGYELGLRGPLASESEFATQIGAFSDITRYEAFLPNSATISGRARYRYAGDNGFTFDAGGGPSLLFPTKGGGSAELILHHHMSAGYRGPQVWTSVGFGGWTFITEDLGGVAQRTINQVGLSAGFSSGQVRPALHIIAPLDDEYNSVVGVVIGFGVSVVMY